MSNQSKVTTLVTATPFSTPFRAVSIRWARLTGQHGIDCLGLKRSKNPCRGTLVNVRLLSAVLWFDAVGRDSAAAKCSALQQFFFRGCMVLKCRLRRRPQRYHRHVPLWTMVKKNCGRLVCKCLVKLAKQLLWVNGHWVEQLMYVPADDHSGFEH